MWHLTTYPFIFTYKTLSITVLDIHYKGPDIFDQRQNKCYNVRLFEEKLFEPYYNLFSSK